MKIKQRYVLVLEIAVMGRLRLSKLLQGATIDSLKMKLLMEKILLFY